MQCKENPRPASRNQFLTSISKNVKCLNVYLWRTMLHVTRREYTSVPVAMCTASVVERFLRAIGGLTKNERKGDKSCQQCKNVKS
jgi:hypothetical protein